MIEHSSEPKTAPMSFRETPFSCLAVLFSLYPLGGILCLVVTWLVPALPLHLGSFLLVLYALPVLLLNGVLSAAAVFEAIGEEEPLFQRILLPIALPFVTWSCGCAFFWWDPLDMMRWLLD